MRGQPVAAPGRRARAVRAGLLRCRGGDQELAAAVVHTDAGSGRIRAVDHVAVGEEAAGVAGAGTCLDELACVVRPRIAHGLVMTAAVYGGDGNDDLVMGLEACRGELCPAPVGVAA